MPDATPVRSLGQADPRGFRLLSDAGLTYADGAEERLAEIVGGRDRHLVVVPGARRGGDRLGDDVLPGADAVERRPGAGPAAGDAGPGDRLRLRAHHPVPR